MTQYIPKNIKSQLYSECVDYVNRCISNAQQAMSAAKESGNDETKSSAGDKHETGRAMAQMEQEKSGRQLMEALELKKMLDKISPEQNSKIVSNGSLVITNQGNFYISISMGKISIENKIYYAISPASPIGTLLLGKGINAVINFNGKSFTIEKIS